MEALLYKPIFLHFAVLLSLLLITRRETDGLQIGNPRRGQKVLIIISVLLVLWIGLRPISFVFGDTGNYARGFEFLNSRDVSESGERIFYGLMWMFKSAGLNVNCFFLLVETIYIGCIAAACVKGYRSKQMYPFVLTLASLSFFSYAVNGIRQGMACSLMLLAYVELKEKKRIIPIICSIIAVGTHTSTLLLVGAGILAMTYKKTNAYLTIWMICILIGATMSGTTEAIFQHVGLISDKDIDYYDNANANMELFSHTGFRYDFMLYSIVPIVIGWYFVVKKKYEDEWYKLIFNIYIIANSFWALVNQSWLSNRVAYLSWCLYAFVMSYPFLMKEYVAHRHTKIALMLIGNVTFTYIMWLMDKYN